jgi:hypothetical protein
MDPSLVWVEAARDLREAPEGKGVDVGEVRDGAAAKATGCSWAAAALAMLPARGTVSSTTTPASQANCFAHRVLQHPR